MIIFFVTSLNLYFSLFTNEAYLTNRFGGPWDLILDFLISLTGVPSIGYEMAVIYKPEIDAIRNYVDDTVVNPAVDFIDGTSS